MAQRDTFSRRGELTDRNESRAENQREIKPPGAYNREPDSTFRTTALSPTRKRLFTWRKLLLIVVILLIIAPVVLIARISASSSVVAEVGSLDASSSAQAKALAVRLRDKVLSTSDVETFSATQDELNGLIQLAMRGFPRLVGRVNVTPWGLEMALSLHVPENPFGDYINARLGLLPSGQGLRFAHSSIGRIRFSGDTTLLLSRWFLDLVLSDSLGSMFIAGIESVDMDGQEVSVMFRPVPDLKERLRRSKQRFEVVRDNLALLGDPAVVRAYYAKLCEIDDLHVSDLPVSMAWYTAAVFSLAKERVQIGNDVVAENRAALLALAIFLGSERFEALVGRVRTGELEDCKPGPDHVVLANRHDLRLHFVFSAVLKVISDSGMSSAAGEFKELLDAGRGGSGFSFADLTADMAGVKLAEGLLDDTGEGWRMLTVLAEATDERVFFPLIDGLPEGLTQEQFEFEYGGLQDPRYRAMVEKIIQRLASLPLYAPRAAARAPAAG